MAIQPTSMRGAAPRAASPMAGGGSPLGGGAAGAADSFGGAGASAAGLGAMGGAAGGPAAAGGAPGADPGMDPQAQAYQAAQDQLNRQTELAAMVAAVSRKKHDMYMSIISKI